MHKTHISDQKYNAKLFFYRPTYPIFSRSVTGNKQTKILGLILSFKLSILQDQLGTA